MRIRGTTRAKRLAAETYARLRNPEIAIAHTFQRPPYGGANQFLLALRDELRRRGFVVEANVITDRTRACLLNSFAFDDERLRRMLRPDCRIVHRVDGPVALYRGFDDGADERVIALNSLAHATVFQSRYSLEAHARLGIELRNPIVIPNAADPSIFRPPPRRDPFDGRRIRIVATSWSSNPNKGWAVLRQLENDLDWRRYDLTFVGQLPEPLMRTRVVPALGSRDLAELLSAQDIYLAPSLNDPCSNALVEALTCGLPAVYARSGGHPELVGSAGLGYDDPGEIPALLDQLSAEHEDRRSKINVASIAQVTDRYLAVLGVVDD